VSCGQCLLVITGGLSRGGLTQDLDSHVLSYQSGPHRFFFKWILKLFKQKEDHTNLVLRESLDVTLHHLLRWDIEILSSMSPNRNPKFIRKFTLD
jgi:hypothetical protein